MGHHRDNGRLASGRDGHREKGTDSGSIEDMKWTGLSNGDEGEEQVRACQNSELQTWRDRDLHS